MIILTITGGLGNQMFQYAYGRALQEYYKEDLILNLAEIEKDDIRDLSLNHLNTIEMMTESRNKMKLRNNYQHVIRKVSAKFLKLVNKDDRQIFQILGKQGIYYSNTIFDYYEFVPTKKKKKYVEGCFQSEKYFKDLECIRTELMVKTEPSYKNRIIINEILSCNAVCVHMRRGDYLNPTHSKGLNVCSPEYYLEGMKYIAERTKDPVFYIFSNSSEDIQWIKENYEFEHNVKYVDMNNPDYEELRLMYSCRHFIISNSTFSWWAQYLSNQDDKVVVAPSKWHNYRNNYKDIYLDTWETIEV